MRSQRPTTIFVFIPFHRAHGKLLNYFDIFYDVDKNDIDIILLVMAAKRKLGIRLRHNKTYRLKKQIMFDHPNLFEEAPPENVNTIT